MINATLSQTMDMDKRKHNDDQILFDLNLLDQMCSGLGDCTQHEIDQELAVITIDESSNKSNVISEHQLMVPSKEQEITSASSLELTDISLPFSVSNGDGCIFWDALMKITLDHKSIETNNFISEEKEKLSEVLRFPELLKTILDKEEHSPLIS